MLKPTHLSPLRPPMGAELSFLLVSLLLLLVVAPFFHEHHLSELVLDGLLTFVLLSGLATASNSRLTLASGLVLVTPVIAARWVAYFSPNHVIELIGMVCGVAFFNYIAIIILAHVMRQRDITRDLIAGALSVYILLGLGWAFAFILLDFLQPQSFQWATLEQSPRFFDMIYFSLVTLTTVGYGDITPASPPARGLAAVEAIIGQFYLTVLVARLVGLHISQRVE